MSVIWNSEESSKIRDTTDSIILCKWFTRKWLNISRDTKIIRSLEKIEGNDMKINLGEQFSFLSEFTVRAICPKGMNASEWKKIWIMITRNSVCSSTISGKWKREPYMNNSSENGRFYAASIAVSNGSSLPFNIVLGIARTWSEPSID